MSAAARRAARWAAPALILIALWLALRPWKEFPLDDDWSYFLEVRRWLAGPSLRILDFTAPNVVAHLWWGGLFAKVLGLSHFALRLSTLVLAASAVLALGRSGEGSERSPAALSPGFLLAACPIFFITSLTYMSDVPFLAWSLLSWACHVRGRRAEDGRWLLLGSACASAALLIRQIGLLLPAAQLWVCWREKRLSWRAAARIAALPLAAALVHRWWFMQVHGPTWAFEQYVWTATLERLARPASLALELYFRAAAGAVYLGLMTLPLAVAARRRPDGRAWLALLPLAPLLVRGGALPYFNGVISARGLGVLSISGAPFKAAGPLGPALGWLLTAAGVWSLIIWASRRTELRAAWQDRDARLLVLAGLLQAAAMAAGPRFFDRYLLPLLAGALLLAHRAAARAAPKPGLTAQACAVLMLAWSFAGALDYLAWNQAKWTLAERAVRSGLRPEEILGGLDWCGLHYYEASMDELKSRKPLAAIGEWEWLRAERFKAVESFSPIPAPGFRVADQENYRTPLSRVPASIYLHARQD